jgi:hypothetical protein
MPALITLKWDIDLSSLMGVRVRIETKDGCIRETIIQDVEWGEVDIIGYTCPLPNRLVLDDSNDYIQLANVLTISLLD